MQTLSTAPAAVTFVDSSEARSAVRLIFRRARRLRSRALRSLCAIALAGLLGGNPEEAAAFDVMSTAYALGSSNTGLGQAPVSASGTQTLERPGVSASYSGNATTDPLWRAVHASLSLDVSNYNCGLAGGGSCGVQVGSVGGTIQDVVHVTSTSAGSHALNVYFKPLGYDGQVSFSGIYGFPTGGLFISNNVTATLPSATPGGAATVFTDIAPKNFSMDTDYTTPVPVLGRTNGMLVTIANGGTFNLRVSWNLQMVLYQGGFATGVTPNAHGSMLSDFSHTVSWGGVDFVTDAVTGRPITDLHFDSQLGTDWSKPGANAPVPEPATWAMWLLGALGLTALRRRARAGPAKRFGLVAPKRWPLRLLAAAAAGLASSASHAVNPSGTNRIWTCETGQWQDLSCWRDQLAPASGDNVSLTSSLFSGGAKATITFHNSIYNQLDVLNLQGSSVWIDQDNGAVLASNIELVDSWSSPSSSGHIQSSGLNLTGQLAIGSSFLSNGDSGYYLHGGTLITGRTEVGRAVNSNGVNWAVFRILGGLHTTDTLNIEQNGRYEMWGGRLNLSNFENSPNRTDSGFDWRFGTVHVRRELAIGDGSMPFNQGSALTVGANRTLGADTLRVPEGRTLAQGGGGVLVDSTDTFINSGTHAIDSGTFTVNGIATSTGLTTLGGGTLDSSFGLSGSYINQGMFTGYGRIQGDVNVVNDGQWLISGGRLQLAASRPMFNTGTVSFASLGDSLDLLPYTVGSFAQAGLINSGLLQLSGQQITGDGLLVNDGQGTVSGWGTVRTSFENQGTVAVAANMLNITHSFSNQGVVELTSPLSRLAGGGVVNEGTVQGLGTVSAPLYNLRGGTVEARGGTLVLSNYLFTNQGLLSAAAGAKLQFSAGLGRNEGQLVLAGGTLAATGPVINSGSISGFGSLQVGSLENAGRLQLTGGTLLLVATDGLYNMAGGQIIASGNANVSFFGAVHLAGGSELRVSEGAVASFFDAVQADSGALFTGAGLKHYEGGFSSTSTVVTIHDPGSVALGRSNVYVAELAGSTGSAALAGSELTVGFDQLLVDGTLTLGGQLRLVEVTGWLPQAGDRLKLFSAGTLVGYFDAIDTSAAPLDPGLVWDFSQLAVNGEIGVSAVPESRSWALWMAGLGALALRSRRGRLQACSS